MKVILSRKGFDSENGGVASPILLPERRLLSLPIPADGEKGVPYGRIRFPGVDVGNLVENLARSRTGRKDLAHLDPDLRAETLPRRPGWMPTFGQANAAQTILSKQGVQEGDLFLFFGWFREVQRDGERWGYLKGSPDLHVIFGWLQVGQKYDLQAGERPPQWATNHPHIKNRYGHGPNCLYVAWPRLAIKGVGTGYPGGGAFKSLGSKLILTDQRQDVDHWLRSRWRLPACFCRFPELAYRGYMRRWRKDVLFRSVRRGQEFVLDCDKSPSVLDWVRGLFVHTERETEESSCATIR